MILLGTSGYSYSDWVGPFYPTGTKKEDMLDYYGRHFPLAELDFTYYQMPGLKVMQGLARKSRSGFLFAVKGFRDMTHGAELSRQERQKSCQVFRASLAPLKDAGKLGCVLLQFPYSFQKTPINQEILGEFRNWLPEIPLVVEFRHQSWIKEATFDFLRSNGFNFCCVDEPQLPGLLPPLAVATGPLSYLRFHGRNKEKWWKPQEAWERYDYLYSDIELKEWTAKIKTLEKHSQTVMVLFNNCHFGQAARNALKLQQLLLELD